MTKHYLSLAERITERSLPQHPITKCIDWKCDIAQSHRGMYMKVGGKTQSVLKIVYELRTGKKLKPNQQVKRSCGNRLCVYIGHLFVVGG